MLVVSRHVDESVIIGGSVRVTVLRDRDGKVRLGIEAPRDVEIWREELYERVMGGPWPGVRGVRTPSER